MYRSLRLAAPLLLLFATSSCSVIRIVEALVVDGALTFVAANPKTAELPYCLMDFELIDEDRTVMWEIRSSERIAEGGTCVSDLPLVYGRAPAGAETLVAPKPLVGGRNYVIQGWKGGQLGGAFHYRADPPAARNIKYGSREANRLMKRIRPDAL